MNYYSLNDTKPVNTTVGFREAMIRGLAPDRGLYFPANIPQLDKEFVENLHKYSIAEIGLRVMAPYLGGEIRKEVLEKILEETLSFNIPLVTLGSNIHTLELFHGPTMAFKDVGARFMARCLGYFNAGENTGNVKVLVATSGDTGGAVAHGFLGVRGVEVIILYPEGMVSDIQERQLTTLGKNITAYKVKGSFDDCQAMVKKAFLDKDLEHQNLTSANSINIARWLPQMLYYFLAVRQLQQRSLNKPVVFSVPSGNFGNICAGILATKMGLKIERFIAATNSNDTIPRYLQKGLYQPQSTIATISNAMDVSDPSNFIRIETLFEKDLARVKAVITSESYTDSETRKGLKELYDQYNYVADPHGAIGYLGAKKALQQWPDHQAVFLETAHPVKFRREVENTLNMNMTLPEQVRKLMDLEKQYTLIQDYPQFKNLLMKK